jgi:acetyltransferase-like isoleucine patch superfamily enzyme
MAEGPGSLPLLRKAQERAVLGVSGLATRVRARWWGVQIASGCRFYGTPILQRARGSRIEIGPRCRFRSRQASNPVGIDRKCVVATMKPGAVLRIGASSGFSGTAITAAQSVVIGERVLCGANVTITDTDWHGTGPLPQRSPAGVAPVVIEDDVWLGLGVVVLKGVTIGSGTAVAAGSVVTSSLPAMVLAGGNPAQVIRALGAEGDAGAAGSGGV